MEIDGIRLLASRVAAMLPAAPPDGDTLNWLGWRELVWDAARRLAELGGDALDELGPVSAYDASATEVSAADILGIAAVFHWQGQLQTGRPAM